jgi:hypothetical protein
MSLAGLGCVKTRSALNRDRRKTALIAQPASEFNLEVEMKILFSSRFGFSSFYTARGQRPKCPRLKATSVMTRLRT